MTTLKTAGKKALSLFLALAMAMSLLLSFSQMVFAEDADTETDAYWSITVGEASDGVVTVTIGLLQDLEGIVGGTFKLAFDTDVFSIAEDEDGYLVEISLDGTTVVGSSGKIAWIADDLIDGVDIEATESLIVYTLTFDDSVDVDYTFTFSASELYDADLEDIEGAIGDDAAATASGTIAHVHTYEVTESTDATCTEAGSATYTCSGCGDTYTEEIAALGHTEGEAVAENEVAATCTETGSYESVVYCTVCGEELSRETVTVEATGHDWVLYSTTESSCTEDGVEVYICSYDNTHTLEKVVEATGHTAGDAVIENSVEATCTTDGSYDTVVYCTVCGAEISRETTVIEAAGHSYEAVVTEATCTEGGYTTYTCSVCGDTYTADETDALGHSYEEDGFCTVCGSYNPDDEDSTYIVSTAAQLAAISDALAGGDSLEGTTVILANDIDLLEYENWTPIGGAAEQTYLSISSQEDLEAALEEHFLIYDSEGNSYVRGSEKNNSYSSDGRTYYYQEGSAFSGTFDGAGYTISNLTIDSDSGYVGLFGEVDGTVENVTVTGTVTTTSGEDFAGGIAGKLSAGGTIDNCVSYVDVTANSLYNVGGVVGFVGEMGEFVDEDNPMATVSNCVNYGDVSGYVRVGGIAGRNAGTVTMCVNHGTVFNYSGSKKGTGGIVGMNGVNNTATDAGIVTYCYNDGYVDCNAGYWTGGIVGFNNSESVVSYCYNAGLMKMAKSSTSASQYSWVNPIVGQNEGTVNDCVWLNEETDDLTAAYIGKDSTGVGNSGGTVTDITALSDEELKSEDAIAYLNVAVTDSDTEGFKANCGTYPVLVTEESTEHTYDEGVVTTEATCTEDGVMTYTCTVCGTTKTEVIEATDHDWVAAEIVDATCTEDGYAEYVCANNSNHIKQVVISATGHTEGEAVIENEVEATCTEDGSYDTVVYCTVCGAVLSRETTVVEATGHTEGEAVVENSVEATCTEDGSYDSVVYCTVCGEELSRETITVAATGHTEGEAVVENEVAATCTTAGSYDSVVYCTVCGTELSRETITVEATGHDWDEGTVVSEVSCTTDGVILYTCKNDSSHTMVEVEEATGHTEGEAVIENAVEATCTTDGSYDSVVYCTTCGEELSRETITVAATGHSYEAVVTEPTCTEGGYTTYTCSACGDTYTADETEATGHSYEVVASEDATCTEDGYATYTCSVCGDTYTEVIEATGHDWDTDNAVVKSEVNCTTAGLTYYTCKNDSNHTKVVKVSATGHSYEAVVTEATCTEGGYTTYTCSVCGDTYTTDETAALGHSYEVTDSAEATCTEDGYTTYTCSTCGDTYTDVITAPGHSYEVTDSKEVTCTEDGYTTYTCSVCGDTYTEVIEATGHTAGDAVVENSTWVSCSEGYTYDSVVYCTVCGTELSRESITVEAGHVYESEQINSCTVQYTCINCGASYISVTGTLSLLEINGDTYLFVGGKFYSTITGFLQIGSYWYYIENGIVDSDYTGFYTYVDDVSYYLVNGVCTLAVSGVVEVDGAYYYVTNSQLQTSINGLIKVSGTWYYFVDGVADYTGLVTQTNGVRYYVENGVCDLATTIIYEDEDGTQYYIKESRVNSTSGLLKVDGTWYYISGGIVQTDYTGLVTQTNGVQYYVENGICDLATTTIYTQDDGTLLYIKDSRVNSTSGLLLVDGTWYYIYSGIVQTGYTGLVTQTNGVTYYIESGVCTLSTSLTVTIGDVTYTIVNSRVVSQA